jgi:hypothetical protein
MTPRSNPDPVAVVDSLRVGDDVLIWATVRDRPGDSRRQLLLAARSRDHGGHAVSPAAVVTALTRRPEWRTAAGRNVAWIGRVLPWTIVGRVGTTVTNEVVGVRIGGQAGVLKVHRAVGDGTQEMASLASLASTGLVPRVLARLDYRIPGQPHGTTLALVTEALSGQILDLPLRESLEQAWRCGAADLQPAVRDLLLAVRAAVGALHRRLAMGRTPEPLPLAAWLPDALADIAAVRELLPRGASAEHRLLDLAAGRARALSRSGGMLAAIAAHGDLHLSQVLVDNGSIRFVDLGAARAAMSPADDFAALHRAVDCFCLDLQLAAAARSGRDDLAHELQQRALAAVSGRRGGEGSRSPLVGSAEAAAAIRVAEEWRRRVVATLVQPAGKPADQLLYLARLLHDLRYHVERASTYYAALAWWHLGRFTESLPRPT